jgi:hypothetical protein
MLSWEELCNITHFELWERRGAKWLGAVTHCWQAWRVALSHLRDRWTPTPRPEEEPRMSTVETPPVAPAMLGRALLAKLDPEAVEAIRAAMTEELLDLVRDEAVTTAKAQLEETFNRRREALLDRLAEDKRQIEDDAEALLDQKIQAALQEQERDWQDRLSDMRTRLRDARDRAQAAETIVVSVFSQLTGGVDQRPVYLHSGGKGLTALSKHAVNAILRRAGVVLRSEASPSPRVVACTLPDGRTVGHTRFWLRAVAPSGETEEADDDPDEAVPALALPEASASA